MRERELHGLEFWLAKPVKPSKDLTSTAVKILIRLIPRALNIGSDL
jgi:hypothetical protein